MEKHGEKTKKIKLLVVDRKHKSVCFTYWTKVQILREYSKTLLSWGKVNSMTTGLSPKVYE